MLVLKQTPGTTDDHTNRWLAEFHASLLARRMTDCAKGSRHGPAAMVIQTRDVMRQAHKHNTTGTSSAKVRDTNLSSWRLSRAIDTQFGSADLKWVPIRERTGDPTLLVRLGCLFLDQFGPVIVSSSSAALYVRRSPEAGMLNT